ncbi:DOPA 4,5-dioxygenase family protein [Vibrio sp. V39_P1S14PM300]|uniref:DOPA 4,5-dioxygenase family protein n=1 Tax=Vibrio sp. V39_P1S14PM300 TaxID=1938690 RepID=UPI0013723B28|nr:DOPA 4,5-dioxygenase family protein [Vibrio sp. V39_P1S14PM300]NAX22241.1 DOPA 4,5-dioxygenase [Vibrio sp. V39_P1S14PM300]
MYHFHVYFALNNVAAAEELHQKIRQTQADKIERIYPLVERLVGPHKMPMFEIHVADINNGFADWLDAQRGDLSVLMHPVTGNDLKDHTEGAAWLGRELGVFEEKL